MIDYTFYDKLENYFSLEEIFPRDMIRLLDGHFLWGWMDRDLLQALYHTRVITDIPILINYGGLQYCGFRPVNCNVGASYSPHRIGKGLDIHTRIPGQLKQLTDFVIEHHKLLRITEIEDPRKTDGWLHLSTRETGLDVLKVVQP